MGDILGNSNNWLSEQIALSLTYSKTEHLQQLQSQPSPSLTLRNDTSNEARESVVDITKSSSLDPEACQEEIKFHRSGDLRSVPADRL